MNENVIIYETEEQLSEILTYLESGIYYLQVENFTTEKGLIFNHVGNLRFEAAKRMRKHDIFFKYKGKGGGLYEVEVSNNQLIDLNAQSKRSKLINTFNELKEGESAQFKLTEIDPVYCRSVLSKLGQPYTTKITDGVIHIIKTSKRVSASAVLKEKINKIEGRGIVNFEGDINYLRQIASNMRTTEFRYSIKQIGPTQYEITRLFFEDLKPNVKPASVYDVITPDYVDFYLEDDEIVFLHNIVKKIQNKIEIAKNVVTETFIPSKPEPVQMIQTDQKPAPKYTFKKSVPDVPAYTPNTYKEYDEDIDENDSKLRDIDGMLENFKMPDLGPDVEDGLL